MNAPGVPVKSCEGSAKFWLPEYASGWFWPAAPAVSNPGGGRGQARSPIRHGGSRLSRASPRYGPLLVGARKDLPRPRPFSSPSPALSQEQRAEELREAGRGGGVRPARRAERRELQCEQA